MRIIYILYIYNWLLEFVKLQQVKEKSIFEGQYESKRMIEGEAKG